MIWRRCSFTRKQRHFFVTDFKRFNNCHIYQSFTTQRWKDRMIISCSDLFQVMTIKPQQITPVILFFTGVILNIMVKLYVLKLRATSVEKTWILPVNVVQILLKQYQMMCILRYRGTTARRIWTPGIPTLCMHGNRNPPRVYKWRH